MRVGGAARWGGAARGVRRAQGAAGSAGLPARGSGPAGTSRHSAPWRGRGPQAAHASAEWGIWCGLAWAAAGGLIAERETRWGKLLSGPLVATLGGLALSNTGLLPTGTAAPAYRAVNGWLLPLAVPMLLLQADLRRVLRDTGRLLGAFVLGAAATVVATVVSLKFCPMGLGAESWRVAAALCARHIGGAVNFVAVAEALEVSGSSITAALAADNLICVVYFSVLFWLSRSIPADAEPASTEAGAEAEGAGGRAGAGAGAGDGAEGGQLDLLLATLAVAFSASVCFAGSYLAEVLGRATLTIPIATVLTVALVSLFPRELGTLAPQGEVLALIVLQFFFAVVGASGSIVQVLRSAPGLFLFCLVQVGLHLGLILAGGRALGFSRKDILLASNANVGGPTTAAGMAGTKGWTRSTVPAMLAGVFGYAVATFVSIALGFSVLKKL